MARKRLAKMFGQEVDVLRDTSVDAAFPLILRRSTGCPTTSCAGWGSVVDARAGPVPEPPRTHGSRPSICGSRRHRRVHESDDTRAWGSCESRLLGTSPVLGAGVLW